MVNLDALGFHAYSGVIHCSLKEVVLTLHCKNALLMDLSDNLKYTQACNRPLSNDFAIFRSQNGREGQAVKKK